MGVTSIEWTDRSANPIRAKHKVTGKVGWHCVKTSPGCAHCYSETINRRFGTSLPFTGRSEQDVDLSFDVRPMEAILKLRKKGQKIFLCDMTDLFGEFVPDSFIGLAFTYMAMAKDQIFQVLTKRPERARRYFEDDHNPFESPRSVPTNVWMGISCEDQQRADERIPELLRIPAAVRFLSVEPLLGPIDLLQSAPCIYHFNPSVGHVDRSFSGIDWVIVGGESGRAARPCDLAWIRSVRDQCQAAGVPAFIKQIGSRPFDSDAMRRVPGSDVLMTVDEAQTPESLAVLGACLEASEVRLRDPKGGDIKEFPDDLKVREFPKVAP